MDAKVLDPEVMAQSRATELEVFFSIPIPIVIFTTALRLYVRKATIPKGSLAADDYLMICATLAAVAVSAVGLGFGTHAPSCYSNDAQIGACVLTGRTGPPYGFGRHKEAITSAQYETFMMGNYIFSHCYDVAIATTKLSVLALYYRIFITPWFRRLVLLTAAFVLLWLLSMEVVLVVGWHPIQRWWSGHDPGSVQITGFAYYTNITNMLADLWIFVMPIPVLLHLQTGLNKRIGLCFLFSFGLGTCVISAVRMKWIFTMDSRDITWDEALKDIFIKLVTIHRGQSQEEIALQHQESPLNSPPDSHEEIRRTGEWVRLRGGVTDMEIV
ncbi:hypothetical protein PG985_000235 [Apiospora marii]|uniref:uncharacterized protein n=1 Tax=Apiospora marii TaxID=335849 RepID=UPI003131F993